MTKGQRYQAINNLIHTSVQDCETSLSHYHDPTLLCDLLIECRQRGHTSREQAVRRRIAKLMKGGN